jgi:hypothetical protein
MRFALSANLVTVVPKNNAIDEMYAIGVLMALVYQVRLLHMIPGQSPFLILFTNFIVTMGNICAILVIIIGAFAASFFTLYFHQYSSNSANDCGWAVTEAGSVSGSGSRAGQNQHWRSVMSGLLSKTVEFAFNGEGDFACAASHGDVQATARLMLVLFLGCVLILVNALIAAMTKLFDEVWETQHILVRCSRIMRLYQAEALKPLPPPFTLLTLPYRTYGLLRPFISGPAPEVTRRPIGHGGSGGGDGGSGGGGGRRRMSGVGPRKQSCNGCASLSVALKKRVRTSVRKSQIKGESAFQAGLTSSTESNNCDDSTQPCKSAEAKRLSMSGNGAFASKTLNRRSTFNPYTDGANVEVNDFRQADVPAPKELRQARTNQRRPRAQSINAFYWQEDENAAKREMWLAWKNSVGEDEAIDHVLAYVSAREDELLEEGRWRTRFARKVHEDAATTTESLAALRESHRTLRESQMFVIRKHDEQAREMRERLAKIEELLVASLGGDKIVGAAARARLGSVSSLASHISSSSRELGDGAGEASSSAGGAACADGSDERALHEDGAGDRPLSGGEHLAPLALDMGSASSSHRDSEGVELLEPHEPALVGVPLTPLAEETEEAGWQSSRRSDLLSITPSGRSAAAETSGRSAAAETSGRSAAAETSGRSAAAETIDRQRAESRDAAETASSRVPPLSLAQLRTLPEASRHTAGESSEVGAAVLPLRTASAISGGSSHGLVSPRSSSLAQPHGLHLSKHPSDCSHRSHNTTTTHHTDTSYLDTVEVGLTHHDDDVSESSRSHGERSHVRASARTRTAARLPLSSGRAHHGQHDRNSYRTPDAHTDERSEGFLDRIQALEPGRDNPARRQRHAAWLMNRPLEGRGHARGPGQPATSANDAEDEEEESSSSDDELVPMSSERLSGASHHADESIGGGRAHA